jgi:hypothetical protein
VSTPEKRCPQCSALLRGDGQWCLLCHADLRPPPPPQPVSVSSDQLAQALLDSLEATPDPLSASTPLDELVVPSGGGGKHARGRTAGRGEPAGSAPVGASTPRAADPDLVGDTDVMFALLRAEGRDPFLSKAGNWTSTPSARFGLIVGGAVVISAALFAVYAVLGLLFG